MLMVVWTNSGHRYAIHSYLINRLEIIQYDITKSEMDNSTKEFDFLFWNLFAENAIF